MLVSRNMQHLNSGFNKLKVDDSTHVKMLKVQEMWKNSQNHWSIISIYWVACVLIYYNKCKIQFVRNYFNILKVNGSTLVIRSNINMGFLIVTCVLINYGKCKIQLLRNGINMLKVDSSTHVLCW
jgi:hypothetical protein